MLLIYSHRKSEISNIDVDRHDDWINHIRNRSFKPLDLIKLMASSNTGLTQLPIVSVSFYAWISSYAFFVMADGINLFFAQMMRGKHSDIVHWTDEKKMGYFNKIIHWQSGSKHIFLSVFLLVRSPSWHAAWACQCASWKNTTSRYDDHPQSCRIWKAIEIDFQP